jgi:hypothetical protein
METEAGARQVLAAIRDTRASDADRKALTTIILKSASGAARQILKDMMTMTEWKDEFIESYVNVGLEQAKAEYVLKALDKRGLDVTAEQRADFHVRRPRPVGPVVRPCANRSHDRRRLQGLTSRLWPASGHPWRSHVDSMATSPRLRFFAGGAGFVIAHVRSSARLRGCPGFDAASERHLWLDRASR